MNQSKSTLRATLACLAFGASISGLSRNAPANADVARLTDGGDTTKEVQLLRKAYNRLEVGNHNYKGHRAGRAEGRPRACAALGSDVTGAVNDHEAQSASDARLKEARDLISQVEQFAEQQNQEVIVKRLKDAMQEIDQALNGK